jgi:glucosylglycerate synthase
VGKTGTIIEDPREAVQRVGTAGVVVAIPTYNNAETIGPLLKTAAAGLAQLPEERVILVHVDGGSTDATVQRALDSVEDGVPLVQIAYPIYPVHRISSFARSVVGRDSAYRTVFIFAQEARARACCILEPDTAAITPEWIASLVQPVVDSDFDLVAPYYQRHKTEGLLVNGLLYPVVRALFGKRIRQPVGSEFGFSASLIRRCLSIDSWQSETISREVDFWITMQALSGNMKVGQARLGPGPRVKRDGTPELSSVLTNIVGALYRNMEETAEVWQRFRGSQPAPTFGLRFETVAEPPPPDVNPMIETFQIGYENLREIWAIVLPPATLLEVKKISREPAASFSVNDDLWARIVYDFAIAHRLGTVSRDHLLRALTPLYVGWAASFVLSVKDLRTTQVEERIERLALAYETQKPYLISRWRWPDRFMP